MMDADTNMEPLNSEMKARLIKAGAALVGFADIRCLPTETRDSMPSAISIAAALDPTIIDEIGNGPTIRYYQDYQRANELLTELCKTAVEFLTRRGNQAIAIKPTIAKEEMDYDTLTTPLPNKTIATRAGMGWIGKSALLITTEYGPAVRLASVLTDAKLETGTPISSSRCGDCMTCVENCPAHAIAGKNWAVGLQRESLFDAFACCETAVNACKNIGIAASVCGVCINACPWTQHYISRELTNSAD
jgi:epoxyqueuosine reductase QueG